MYSAATMAVAYDLIERLIVDTTVAPLETVNAARDLQNSAGSATCSITLNKKYQLTSILDATQSVQIKEAKWEWDKSSKLSVYIFKRCFHQSWHIFSKIKNCKWFLTIIWLAITFKMKSWNLNYTSHVYQVHPLLNLRHEMQLRQTLVWNR